MIPIYLFIYLFPDSQTPSMMKGRQSRASCEVSATDRLKSETRHVRGNRA